MKYFSFDTDNFLSTTRNLSNIERGVYIMLICKYIQDDGAIEVEEKKIFRFLNAHTEQDKEAVRNVLDEFFVKTPKGYWSEQCELVLMKISEKSKLATASINRRWDAKRRLREMQGYETDDSVSKNDTGVSKNDTDVTVLDTNKERNKERNKQSKDTTSSLRSEKTLSRNCSPSFLTFWDAFPENEHKGSKDNAWKVWQERDLEPLADRILTDVEKQKKENPKWSPNKKGETYIKAGHRYLTEIDVEKLPAARRRFDQVDEPHNFFKIWVIKPEGKLDTMSVDRLNEKNDPSTSEQWSYLRIEGDETLWLPNGKPYTGPPFDLEELWQLSPYAKPAKPYDPDEYVV